MTMTPFSIYRAQALTDSLQAGGLQRPRTTLRLPSNVPYVVDNLWEFLRPDHMPSRRYSIYASPTPELARQNCSGSDQGQGLCVYRLVIQGEALLAQLPVKDAREHADVQLTRHTVQSVVQQMADASAEEKSSLGLLFLPGASRADWERARAASALAAQLIDTLSAASTFWRDASPTPNSDSNGELFLQLLAGAGYQAADLQRYPAA